MSGKNVESLFTEGRLSVITFSTRDATFAIPLEQVRYIEKDVERNIKVDQQTQFNHEVITFQNRAVPLYDFCNLTGSKSATAQAEDLLDTLNAREQDHIEWVAELEKAIKTKTPFTKTTDPNKCAFGIWYNKFKTNDKDLEEVMEKFDQPHRRLHEMAAELLPLSEINQDEALAKLKRERTTTFGALRNLFENARERVTATVRPIIVFVEQGKNKISALRLDNIQDIQTYGLNDFSDDESTEGIMKRKSDEFLIEGYLRNGDGPPIILINCQPLKA
ncbi:MAG: CZB domain-containing protein [Pseudomonadales bacterium]|uniref:Chemoreceptor zinc-binding domain-containing protein n=1 Tax=Oleiphilus messinensis TaxID=141451 RepID=A0A1Y0IDD5_9GAMM|nr:CZB domain-containing protein [Oleiphilus messinensis]ARU58169.1 hypothetical protein OLMES_4152 [Oleiphilus messinensis]MCG8609762.1 CZB domain-containing protein [Pseudomonadales bacterium]